MVQEFVSVYGKEFISPAAQMTAHIKKALDLGDIPNVPRAWQLSQLSSPTTHELDTGSATLCSAGHNCECVKIAKKRGIEFYNVCTLRSFQIPGKMCQGDKTRAVLTAHQYIEQKRRESIAAAMVDLGNKKDIDGNVPMTDPSQTTLPSMSVGEADVLIKSTHGELINRRTNGYCLLCMRCAIQTAHEQFKNSPSTTGSANHARNIPIINHYCVDVDVPGEYRSECCIPTSRKFTGIIPSCLRYDENDYTIRRVGNQVVVDESPQLCFMQRAVS